MSLNPTDVIGSKTRVTPVTRHGNPTSLAQTRTVGVLLIGADFQALGVARALAVENIPVFLLEQERGIARFSRFIARRQAKHDLLTDPTAVDYLLRLAEQESLHDWVIFCVDDETVEFLAKNRAALSQSFVVPVPEWDVTKNFYEKDRAYRLAQRAGIPVPTFYPSGSLDELANQDIAYPVVLKPTFKKNYYNRTKDKAILVQNRAGLIREYKAMNGLIDARQILVQEFLPGGTRNLFSFAAVFDGEKVVAGLSAQRLRQHPMMFGHATTYAESRDMPELEELAARFLKAARYRGVAEVEFMFDERTETFKLIEMNGRFWGWHTLTYHAGLNFPLSLFHMLQGIEVKRQQPENGVAWVRLLTDAPTVACESLRGRSSPLQLAKLFLRRTPDAVWSWKDPLPFLTEVAMAPYLWWTKGF